MSEKTKILVCVKCRAPGESKDLPFDQRAGGRLLVAMNEAAAGAGDVEIVPVECLSVCNRPVTIGLASAGKWSYVYGDFPEEAAPDILEAARLYAGTPDGVIPKDQRTAALRLGRIARTPPL